METPANNQLIQIVEEAGDTILAVKEHHTATKADGTPVTAADRAAHEVVMGRLKELSDLPIISEEADTLPGEIPPLFWLLDPLDGTKELIKDSGEFTVNLALVDKGVPVRGFVHLPARDLTYFGDRSGAFLRRARGELERIQVRHEPIDPIRIAVSRDHITEEDEAVLCRFDGCERIPAGSALKLCLVAEGSADLYVRCGNTMEWDIAAAHAVLKGAGGYLRTLDGEELVYGKSSLRNPGFIAAGSQTLLERALA